MLNLILSLVQYDYSQDSSGISIEAFPFQKLWVCLVAWGSLENLISAQLNSLFADWYPGSVHLDTVGLTRKRVLS
jgi:hypothetical protein